MAKQKVLQTNFTGGELSPLMLGRVDTVKYQNGAALIKNMIVRQQGGLWGRQGTKFVNEVKTSAKKTIVVDFEYSDVQPYVIEFGDLYFRIYYDGGFVETSPGSGVPLDITTLYTETQLASLTFCQTADVLYVFSPYHIPRKVKRLGANSWSISNCDFQDGPYLNDPGVECDVTLSSVGNYALAESTTGIFSAYLSVSKVITSVALNAGNWEFTSVAHGFSTTNTINISDVGFQIAYQGTTRYIYITGRYVITKVNNNVFRITTQPTWFPTDGGTVWTVAGSLAQKLIVPQIHVDYRVNGIWYLAEVITIKDNTHATVRVIDNVKVSWPGGAYVYWEGTNQLVGNMQGIFDTSDQGNYIRDVQGAWWQSTGLLDDTTAYHAGAGTNLNTITYAYATIAVTVGVPIRMGVVTSKLPLFTSTDINRPMRFNFGGKRPWGKLSGYVSSTVMFIDLQKIIPIDPILLSGLYNNGITSLWQIGAWSDTTGYPRTCAFHEQRLWAGGTAAEPVTIWGSQPNDFENEASTEYDSLVLDTNAINYTLVSNKANPIVWLLSTSSLLVGTLGSEWQVKAASTINQPITPTNINVTPQTNNGSLSGTRPIRLGNAIAFLQKAGKKAIEISYDFQQDSFVGRNMTVVSEHILRRGGKGIITAYQQEPNNIIWVVLNDGTLAACTYDKDQQVMAWHQHALAGGGIVESIATVNSTAGTETLLYMVVRRTINGASKRYIEYLTADFFPTGDSDIANAYFLDCGLTYSGAPATTITGLTHLNGETVSVVADGIYIGEKVVSSNQITISPAASVVHIGYKYQQYVKTLPLEGGSPGGGTAQGKAKRIGKVSVRVCNSREFKYGANLQNLDEKKIVDGNGVPVNKMSSEDQPINMPLKYDFTAQFYLVQDKPYPFIVLSIAADTEVTT